MKTTSAFAELYGAFAGDGWISRGNSGLTLFITGNPADEKEYYRKRIRSLFKETVGLSVVPRDFKYWGTFGVMVCRKKIIETFISMGAPIGKKAQTIKVPDFVLSTASFFIAFARGLFDTDGCVDFRKSYGSNASIWQKTHYHRPRAFFATVSYPMALGLQQGFQKTGLWPALRPCKPSGKCKSVHYRLEFEGKKKVSAFFAKMGLQNPKHLAKFNRWRKQGFYTLP